MLSNPSSELFHGHMSRNRPWRTGPWHSDICYYCKRLGHWKQKCPERKRDIQLSLLTVSYSCGPIAATNVRWYWVAVNNINTYNIYNHGGTSNSYYVDYSQYPPIIACNSHTVY